MKTPIEKTNSNIIKFNDNSIVVKTEQGEVKTIPTNDKTINEVVREMNDKPKFLNLSPYSIQQLFEQEVMQIFKINDYISQGGEGSDQMIIDDDMSDEHWLSGSIGHKCKGGDIILVATKDEGINDIENISLEMVQIIAKTYCNNKRKVILATNIPIDIHSSKSKDFKRECNLHIESIGYSFCKKHNLVYVSEFSQ